MDNIKQIQVVSKALNKEKDKFLFELARTLNLIEKKHSLIKKMSDYLKDYFDESNLQKSKLVPTLAKNLNSFSLQIENVIAQTEGEIVRLKRSSEVLMSKVQRIDQKINVMDVFANRIKSAKLYKAEKLEQSSIDDISSTKHLRGFDE